MNMPSLKIAPSILSADFARLRDEIEMVSVAGADLLHLDVMDGHFVPNITFGPCVVEAVKKVTSIPLDVHLMITDAEKYLKTFVAAGSDWITFHIEAVANPHQFIEQAKNLGVKVGVSLKPLTPVTALKEILPEVDLILIMSVEPGFGGQKFQSAVLSKITELRQQYQFLADISIDGGINLETAPLAVEAGANILVAGSAIFHADDPESVIRKFKAIGHPK